MSYLYPTSSWIWPFCPDPGRRYHQFNVPWLGGQLISTVLVSFLFLVKFDLIMSWRSLNYFWGIFMNLLDVFFSLKALQSLDPTVWSWRCRGLNDILASWYFSTNQHVRLCKYVLVYHSTLSYSINLYMDMHIRYINLYMDMHIRFIIQK